MITAPRPSTRPSSASDLPATCRRAVAEMPGDAEQRAEGAERDAVPGEGAGQHEECGGDAEDQAEGGEQAGPRARPGRRDHGRRSVRSVSTVPSSRPGRSSTGAVAVADPVDALRYVARSLRRSRRVAGTSRPVARAVGAERRGIGAPGHPRGVTFVDAAVAVLIPRRRWRPRRGRRRLRRRLRTARERRDPDHNTPPGRSAAAYACSLAPTRLRHRSTPMPIPPTSPPRCNARMARASARGLPDDAPAAPAYRARVGNEHTRRAADPDSSAQRLIPGDRFSSSAKRG